MALAQIIDLEERRRARRPQADPAPVVTSQTPMWCFMWMPVYFWYVA